MSAHLECVFVWLATNLKFETGVLLAQKGDGAGGGLVAGGCYGVAVAAAPAIAALGAATSVGGGAVPSLGEVGGVEEQQAVAVIEP